MLTARLFIYVVDRDFGFAPNPFHGVCTLATCKARIRQSAVVGDWVIGMGGRRLGLTGRCIFAMRVEEKLSYNSYWNDARFQIKKPFRNGSRVALVGDNIYHKDNGNTSLWMQEDSHHSNPDGSPNQVNVLNDTKADAVLISRRFFYFGSEAPKVPEYLLSKVEFKNGRNYRVFNQPKAEPLLAWINGFRPNYLHGDPADFRLAHARYSGKGSRIHTT
jgi:hypothetical protein